MKKREGLKYKQTQQTDNSDRHGTMKVKVKDSLEHHPFFKSSLSIPSLLPSFHVFSIQLFIFLDESAL